MKGRERKARERWARQCKGGGKQDNGGVEKLMQRRDRHGSPGRDRQSTTREALARRGKAKEG